jgi:hypothetical protein
MRLGRLARRVLGISLGVVAVGFSLGPGVNRDTNTGFDFYHYLVEIGDERQMVSALDGGFVSGNVVSEQTPDGSNNKHLSGTSVDPVRVRMQIQQFTPFLTGSFNNTIGKVDGRIYYLDESSRLRLQRDLKGMLLRELSLPSLNWAGKNPWELEMVATFDVDQSTLIAPAPEASLPTATAGDPNRPREWKGSWMFSIPGMETSNAAVIEPIALKRQMVASTKDASTKPGGWNCSNIVLTMPPGGAGEFIAWHEDFVIKGNNDDKHERTCVLDLIDENRTTLLRFAGTGVGIISCKLEQPITPNAAAPLGYRIEMYVENVQVSDPNAPKDIFKAPPKLFPATRF